MDDNCQGTDGSFLSPSFCSFPSSFCPAPFLSFSAGSMARNHDPSRRTGVGTKLNRVGGQEGSSVLTFHDFFFFLGGFLEAVLGG